MDDLEVYLVGGAVRDRLLGLPVRERDWVVVGASPEALRERGFRQVGKDFPVFLHPETGEEYALARAERKTGRGYHGFSFDTSSDVSLEDDLRRRDLTINAMAETADGALVDPWGGRQDLERRRLRHVSPAFREDPLRILRVARFAARLHDQGFAPAADTLELMREMVAGGELGDLAPERVWQETERALAGPHPETYFEVLRDCGALAALFPEIDALYGVPQPAKWHPEIDTGVHTMMVLAQAARLSDSLAVRFAALTHDLGKGETPPEILPSHKGHERRSVRLVGEMCERLPVPRRCRELALLVAELHGHAHKAAELRPATVLKVLEKVDAFRRPDRWREFLLACEADARGRTGYEDAPYPQAALLERAYEAAAAVSAQDLPARETLDGREIGVALRRERVRAVAAALSD